MLKENAALKNLSEREDIVVRQADKGGAVIVLDSELYRSLNRSLLDDPTTYRKQSQDPTAPFLKHLNSLLNIGEQLEVLSNTEVDKLMVNFPVVPIFHSFPKYHKEVFPPPLRPIVTGIGSIGEGLGAWVDAYLQPLVNITPSFIRDTKDLVVIMEGQKWQSRYCWLLCDVCALYPSITQYTNACH